jgi:hypothetical protein
MNFHFIWKCFDVVSGDTVGIFEQTVYGDSLVDAVNNWVCMHGELSVDEYDQAHEIISIKETD